MRSVHRKEHGAPALQRAITTGHNAHHLEERTNSGYLSWICAPGIRGSASAIPAQTAFGRRWMFPQRALRRTTCDSGISRREYSVVATDMTWPGLLRCVVCSAPLMKNGVQAPWTARLGTRSHDVSDTDVQIKWDTGLLALVLA
jgi:hypothetical protein